jgi:hypothetical protein
MPKAIAAIEAECKRESWQPAPPDPGYVPGGIRERAIREVYERQGYSEVEIERIIRKHRVRHD